MSNGRWTRILLPAGALAVIGGAVTIVVATPPASSASFGWFAYAPLSGAVFAPEAAAVVSTASIVGAGVVALGLAAVAFWGGYRLGVRRGTA